MMANDDEARDLIEGLDLGHEVAIQQATQLASTHLTYYKVLREGGVPEEMAKEMTFSYCQYLYQSGIMSSLQEINEQALKAMRENNPDDD